MKKAEYKYSTVLISGTAECWPPSLSQLLTTTQIDFCIMLEPGLVTSAPPESIYILAM